MEQDEYECEDEYRNDEDEKEENVCTDEQEKTFAQSCHTLFFNKIHLAEVQDAVSRMNRIKMLAGELLSLHIHKCLDNDIPLPKFTQTWCRQLYKEVSTLADNKQILLRFKTEADLFFCTSSALPSKRLGSTLRKHVSNTPRCTLRHLNIILRLSFFLFFQDRPFACAKAHF